MGSLGVLVRVKLQCEPNFNLKCTNVQLRLQDVLDNLDEHLESSEHPCMIWWPFTDKVSLQRISRTDEPINCPPPSMWSVFWYRLTVIWFPILLVWLSTFIPSLVRLYLKFCAYILWTAGECVDWGPNIFRMKDLYVYLTVSEFGIPRRNAVAALKEIKDWLHGSGNLPCHNPSIIVRPTKGDDHYLSHAHSDGVVVYFNILIYRPFNKQVPKKQEFFDGFYEIMLKYGGRPHWGKEANLTAKEYRTMYPDWHKFQRIRKQLDPNGIFLNDYLKQCLEE